MFAKAEERATEREERMRKLEVEMEERRREIEDRREDRILSMFNILMQHINANTHMNMPTSSQELLPYPPPTRAPYPPY